MRTVHAFIFAIPVSTARRSVPKPFVWTARANDFLQKAIRANGRRGSKKNEALH
jgi:hypothetical protein